MISRDCVMGFLAFKYWEGNRCGSFRSFLFSLFYVFSIELCDIEILQEFANNAFIS